ncbi:MAG: hypothetical protein ABJE47_02955 [bacterium]
MRLRRVALITAAAICATGAVAARPHALRAGLPATENAAEIARIRSHFDSVLTELAARDVAALTPAQRVRRGELVTTLTAYRARGVFPHNYDFPGQAMPYFVDRGTGTLCAVAHLLEHTGHRDIVDRVAAMNNNVWVPQLAGDAAFTAWLAENGITLAEAARIQVPYLQPTSNAQVARNVAFVTAAPLVLSGVAVTSLWNAFGNADGHRTAVTKLGIVSGLASGLMGVALLTKNDISPTWGTTALAMGGASIALSSRAMYRQSILASERANARGVVADAALTPTIDAHGAGARVGVSIGF